VLSQAHRCFGADVEVVAFGFRDIRREIAVHVLFALTTTATTAATATTTLFAITCAGFLIDRCAVFAQRDLATRQFVGRLRFGLRHQCVGGFGLRLAAFATLGALATFTALAAFLTFATSCAFDSFRTLGATAFARFTRLALFTRFTAFACLTRLARFAIT